MALYIGGRAITGLYQGGRALTQLRQGGQLLWSPDATPGGTPSEPGVGAIRDNFKRDNSDWLGHDWTDFGPSEHRIGITHGMARMAIKRAEDVDDSHSDGQNGKGFTRETSRARYSTRVLGKDNASLEFRVASTGDGISPSSLIEGYTTDVLARVDDQFNTGFGVRLNNTKLTLVRRVSGADHTVLNEWFPFSSGDRVQLLMKDNTYRLYVEYDKVTEWADTAGTVATGEGRRGLGLRMDGARDLHYEVRRFSPRLSYVSLS